VRVALYKRRGLWWGGGDLYKEEWFLVSGVIYKRGTTVYVPSNKIMLLSFLQKQYVEYCIQKKSIIILPD
jgi:hypothetical protein